MKSKNKFVAVMLLFLVLFSSFIPVVNAVEINSAYLENGASCKGHLQYNFDGIWADIRGNLIHYNLNGVKYPAYCISTPQTPGVDEKGSYTVNITELLDDVRIWRVIVNGYPYQTPAQMGVETEEDAYMTTKQAIYCIMFNRNVTALYRGKDERGNKMMAALVRLVDIGRNGTQTPQSLSINAVKSGTLYEEENNYVQKYNVSSAVDIKSYTITSTANMPKGAIITNSKGISTSTFSGNESFYVKIPKTEMVNDINIVINLQGKCKTYPVFYGRTPNSGWQDYAVTFDPYGDGFGTTKLSIATNTASLKIIKKDKDTGNTLAGVTFNIKYENGTNIGDFTTNKDGIITISGLRQANIVVQEKNTLEKYILNTNTFKTNTVFNKQTTIEITNEHKDN